MPYFRLLSSPRNRIIKPTKISFYDLEDIVQQNNISTLSASSQPYKINLEAEQSSCVMKRKIVHLLSDNDGEKMNESSIIAHKASYSKISEYEKEKEERRRKDFDMESERDGVIAYHKMMIRADIFETNCLAVKHYGFHIHMQTITLV